MSDEGFCQVHEIKCQEMADIKLEGRKKVPIWAFLCFVGISSSIMSYQIFELRSQVRRTERIFFALNYGLEELSYNQSRIMDKLELEYKSLKRYRQGGE